MVQPFSQALGPVRKICRQLPCSLPPSCGDNLLAKSSTYLRISSKINFKVWVLVAGGHSADAPMKEAIEDGARGYLSKPYDIHRMLKVVREVLNEE